MKAVLIKTSVLCGLFLILAVAGNAQGSQRYRAAIPFDFQVRDAHFAAGDYALEPFGTNLGSGSVAIRERRTGKGQVLGLNNVGGNSRMEKGKLIFTKVNGRYILTEVTTPTFGILVRPSKRPSGMAMTTNPKTETVVVLLDN